MMKDQQIWDRIERVERDKKRYLSLLLLADEQENMVDRYLERGTLYVLEEDGIAKAECVITDEGEGILEIKSLAVAPEYQGKGYGHTMIRFTPWVGFVYTFPAFRGKRHMGQLLDHAAVLARLEGKEAIYISTGETGLYEKYGYSSNSNISRPLRKAVPFVPI